VSSVAEDIEITPEQIAADVDRGLAITKQLKDLKAELKVIEGRLEKAGLEGEQVPLVDEEREGKQFIARGSSFAVPVVFTADLLRASFVHDGDVYKIIKELAGDKLPHLYKKVTKWETLHEDGKDFRRVAADVLGEQAPQVISACLQRDNKTGIPKSAIKIEWTRAEEIKPEEVA
jgi:hypothetical protein